MNKDPKARYYDAGGIETLDIIKAKLTPEQYKGWLLGNCIKYTCRANHKDQFDRDVEKVAFYSRELQEQEINPEELVLIPKAKLDEFKKGMGYLLFFLVSFIIGWLIAS